MPNKPNKFCAAFPCRNLAVNGAYCHEHKPAKAPKETDPFYLSVAWRRFRNWFISKYPLCQKCLEEGRETPAVMVDHIIEIKDGGALTDEDNAMSLCHKCHNMKSAAERSRRKNHQQSRNDNRVDNFARKFQVFGARGVNKNVKD